MLTLASALPEMFGVQLYKNNARALLSHISSILNLDWLQHARSVRGVYECFTFHYYQSLALDCKKSTPTESKLPGSQPDPFPGSWTILSPELSKICPCNPNFLGGCTVWSENPRQSGAPHSSLILISNQF